MLRGKRDVKLALEEVELRAFCFLCQHGFFCENEEEFLVLEHNFYTAIISDGLDSWPDDLDESYNRAVDNYLRLCY